MRQSKTVKDIMVDVFDYPHMPHWFTIKQALGIVSIALSSTSKQPEPLAILVFDEKYNLMGTLGIRDIIRGLEPRFLKPTASAQVPDEDETGLSVLWETLFDRGAAETAERPVSEVMVPASLFVRPEDPVTKAAYLMVRHELVLLPVLEDNRKFAGIVRMREIFSELSGAILKLDDKGGAKQ
ncbi:MAG: CBS domain-containing protein [Nitrospiraceae bacterium]|nr:MAG: CBS domain-containing protein [Nitrospiraceae bacterium]